jgi:hypothetical protein
MDDPRIIALGRCLRNEWSLDAIGPVPNNIARLVRQFEAGEPELRDKDREATS